MTINPERWTLKTQEALASAVDRARSHSNAEVTPDHVLAAVLDQADGIAGPILTRVGVEPAVVRQKIGDDLARLPQALGGAEPGINRALRDVLEAADGMGLTRNQRLWRVEMPLAVPTLSPDLTDSTSFASSLARFCCGRMRRK